MTTRRASYTSINTQKCAKAFQQKATHKQKNRFLLDKMRSDNKSLQIPACLLDISGISTFLGKPPSFPTCFHLSHIDIYCLPRLEKNYSLYFREERTTLPLKGDNG